MFTILIMKTFLPKKDPLQKYNTSTKSLETLAHIADQLPKLLLTGTVQKTIKSLSVNALSIDKVIKNNDQRELKLAMAHL